LRALPLELRFTLALLADGRVPEPERAVVAWRLCAPRNSAFLTEDPRSSPAKAELLAVDARVSPTRFDVGRVVALALA
jgi:hypothetical protein